MYGYTGESTERYAFLEHRILYCKVVLVTAGCSVLLYYSINCSLKGRGGGEATIACVCCLLLLPASFLNKRLTVAVVVVTVVLLFLVFFTLLSFTFINQLFLDPDPPSPPSAPLLRSTLRRVFLRAVCKIFRVFLQGFCFRGLKAAGGEEKGGGG